jgi:hypothetical protein
VSFVHGLELVVAHALSAILNRAQNLSCTVITDLDTSKRAHRKPFPAVTPSWKLAPRPAVSMRSELLVAHKKLGQLLLLAVYIVPVKVEK